MRSPPASARRRARDGRDSTIDAEGCLWVGLFAGCGVRRYAPDGTLPATVSFPVANAAEIAFGGPDLRTAYATTARRGLSPAALCKQSRAGDLFAFDAGIAALAVSRTSATVLSEMQQR